MTVGISLEQAIQAALDGRALLFVGAGFSRDATNARGTGLKDGAELAEHLRRGAGFPDSLPLTDAAEEFAEVSGDDALIAELRAEYTVKTTSSAQRIIASLPWRRVYTTNYDNVLEQAAIAAGKSLTPATLGDEAREVVSTGAISVHLNGFIGRLDRGNLWTEIKLTDTSYLTGAIVDSEWAFVFRQDLALADAVFFVGYSVADLDIARLLLEETASSKSHFILGDSPSSQTLRKAAKFGVVHKFSVATLGNRLSEAQASFEPSEYSEPLYYCFEPIRIPDAPTFVEDRGVFDLFLRGDFDHEAAWQSLHGGAHYYLERSEVHRALDRISANAATLVATASLGNGKTVFLRGLGMRLAEAGRNVVLLKRIARTALEELDQLLAAGKPLVLLIDDYPNAMNLVRHAVVARPEDLVLVLSARTQTHDLFVDDLQEALGKAPIEEIPLDHLSDSDTDWLVDAFDEYGLWGENAASSRTAKRNVIRQHCNAEFHGVLLRVMEAPQILDRLNRILRSLEEEHEFYDVVLSILILTILNHRPTLDLVVDLCGEAVLQPGFRRSPLIREMIDFDRGRVSFHSSVAAEFILKRLANPTVAVRALLQMAEAADKAARFSRNHYDILKSLMRFANVQIVLPENNRQTTVLKYYERMKLLRGVKHQPLFWLQYAMACVQFRQFDRAGRYFKNAYALAANRPAYNTFQIDNHFARYLLLKVIEEGDAAGAMAAFRQARTIINHQIQTDQRLHYPFRVAGIYRDFLETFGKRLTSDERDEIRTAVSFVLERIKRLPEPRQSHRNVRDCKQALGAAMTALIRS